MAEKPSKVYRSNHSFKFQVLGFKFLLAALCLHIAALFFLTGCSISYGVYHKVDKGQTLYRIAKTYDVDIQDLAEFNDITDVTEIKEGQRLFIIPSLGVVIVRQAEPGLFQGNAGFSDVKFFRLILPAFAN